MGNLSAKWLTQHHTTQIKKKNNTTQLQWFSTAQWRANLNSTQTEIWFQIQRVLKYWYAEETSEEKAVTDSGPRRIRTRYWKKNQNKTEEWAVASWNWEAGLLMLALGNVILCWLCWQDCPLQKDFRERHSCNGQDCSLVWFDLVYPATNCTRI